MVSSAEPSAPAPRNTMRWLRALKMDLDSGADSSDATPEPTKQISDRERKKRQTLERKAASAKGNASGGGGPEPGTGRQDAVRAAKDQPQEIRDAADAQEPSRSRRKPSLTLDRKPRPSKERTKSVFNDASATAARKKPAETKVNYTTVLQRKRPRAEASGPTEKVEAKSALPTKSEPPLDPAKATAAAMRQRRMHKLQARRKATGEYDRLVAVKLKRHDSKEASRLQRNMRDQIRRAEKRPAADQTDVQTNDSSKRKPRVLTEEEKERRRIQERQRRAAIKAKKEELATSANVPPTPKLKSPAIALEKRRRRREEVLHLLGNKRHVVHGGNAEPVRKRRKIPHEGEEIQISRTDRSDDGTAVNGASPSGEDKIHVKTEAADSGLEDEVDTNGTLPESQPQLAVKEEPRPATAAQDDVKEKGQVSPPLLGVPVKQLDDSTKNDLLLDMMPIPRKSASDNTQAAASADSFVIPKRPANKPAEPAGTNLASRPNDNGRKLERAGAEVKLEPSAPASSQLSKREPIRVQRKRTKNVVPVKAAIFSAPDRALMRRARKRNSILFAVAELEAEAASNSSTKAHMAGYEVYDVDGKVLPDLVPRLSCATKGEMAANKDSFTASYFGVALSAPVAKGGADPAVDECIEGRKLNCYEELRFERPEDREFYQRRMYGTTFVPQHLRGWTTLILRRVRFERKSTGIRFNQDRDREEFAASLSKRYSFNSSVPRCAIPRENWLKMMKGQPSTAYLHYPNREDAERASHVFRDDLGNPLEMKLEYKAGVVISRSSSPADNRRYNETPRRSYSSERSEREGGSARSTPRWKQERQSTTNKDYPFSRSGRPPAARRTEEGGRCGSPINEDMRPHALLGRRSRSRSRSNSCAKADSDTGTTAQADAVSSLSETVNKPRENEKEMESNGSSGSSGSSGVNDSASKSKSDEPGNIDSQARAASPTEPPPLPTGTTGSTSISKVESGEEEEQEEGEIESSTAPVTSATGHDERPRGRSPSRGWHHGPREQQGYSAAPREPARGYHPHPYNQQYNRDPDRWQHNHGPDRRRSRSRSRPRDNWCEPGRSGGGGWSGSYPDERRHLRGPDPAGGYGDDGRGRRMHPNEFHREMGRYGGRDHRDGGCDSRNANAYSRRY